MAYLPHTLRDLNLFGKDYLPGLFGMEILSAGDGSIKARMPIRSEHLAPNGFLHAASVIALADTACGYGTIIRLPEGAESFTTIELKSNFLGTCRSGAIACEATRMHGGRSTQVWDAVVKDESNGRLIALFRCTQMILYPKT
jgi:1,4-dihydroxy-2-naphthoyl-CoA hydrolase